MIYVIISVYNTVVEHRVEHLNDPLFTNCRDPAHLHSSKHGYLGPTLFLISARERDLLKTSRWASSRTQGIRARKLM